MYSFNLAEMRTRKFGEGGRSAFTNELNSKWAETHPNDINHFSYDAVTKMEEDPSNIPLDALFAIIQVFGITFDQLLKPEINSLKIPPIQDNGTKIVRFRNDIFNFKKGITQLDEWWRDYYPETQVVRKPRIACIGRPDAGKSRMLNTLLEKELLPANWTPTTSTLILIKSSNDKPMFENVERDDKINSLISNNVWVFKSKEDKEFDANKIFSSDYCRENIKDSGDYEILKKYADYTEINDELDDVGAIVVFASPNDSPILKNCDLIDAPGYDPRAKLDNLEIDDGENIFKRISESRDTKLELNARSLADAYIFISPANSFMYGDDLAFAASLVKSLPVYESDDEDQSAFDNIFFVASQANTVCSGDVEMLESVLESGAQRLWQIIERFVRENDSTHLSYEYKDFRARFYTSEIDSAELSNKFITDLTEFLQAFPDIVLKSQKKELIDIYRTHQLLMAVNSTAAKLIDSLEKNKILFVKAKSAVLSGKISVIRAECHNELAGSYHSIIDKSYITALVEKNNIKKNKRDLNRLITIINSDLSDEVSAIIKRHISIYESEIDNYINSLSDDINDSSVDLDYLKNILHPTERALVGALMAEFEKNAKTSPVSSLKFKPWKVASTVAGTLSGAAIGLLSVPITGLLAGPIAGILALGGTWKSSVGGKLKNGYDSSGLLDAIIDYSDQYWDDISAKSQFAVDIIIKELSATESKDTSENRDDYIQRIIDYIEEYSTENSDLDSD